MMLRHPKAVTGLAALPACMDVPMIQGRSWRQTTEARRFRGLTPSSRISSFKEKKGVGDTIPILISFSFGPAFWV